MMKAEKGGIYMKCQHCGINFSDEDRECPICGARAGSRGRVGEMEKKAAAWRERQFADKPTYQKTSTRKTSARAKKATPSVKPIKETPKGKGKVAAVVAAAVVIINLLPGIASVVGDIAEHYGSELQSIVVDMGWGENVPDAEAEAWDSYDDSVIYYTPGDTYTYDADNYISVYVRLSDLIGDGATATLSDGTTMQLVADAGSEDRYTLTLDDGTGIYEESGYYWGVYNYPEEAGYSDNYPPEQYDTLVLCLTLEELNYNGSLHERYDPRQENMDLWLLAYVDRETGLITLQDIDDSGIFGADTFVVLNGFQQG